MTSSGAAVTSSKLPTAAGLRCKVAPAGRVGPMGPRKAVTCLSKFSSARLMMDTRRVEVAAEVLELPLVWR